MSVPKVRLHHPLVHAFLLVGVFMVSLLPVHLTIGLHVLLSREGFFSPLFPVGVLLSAGLFITLSKRCRRAWATQRGVELSSPPRFLRWREIRSLKWVYGGILGGIYSLELRDGSRAVFGGSPSTLEHFWKLRPRRRAPRKGRRTARRRRHRPEALHGDGTVLYAFVVLALAAFVVGAGPRFMRALQDGPLQDAARLAALAGLILWIAWVIVKMPSVHAADDGLEIGRLRRLVPWGSVRAVVPWFRGMDAPPTIWFTDGKSMTFFGAADAKMRCERRERSAGSISAESKNHGHDGLFRT